MRHLTRSYASLNSTQEPNHVSWFWRVLAFLSSWMILGGFLTLPPLFDTNAQLRLSPAALTILATALVTAGISVTVFLCCVLPSWEVRVGLVFVPCLSTSTLACLSLLYTLAVSSADVWNGAALTGVITSLLSTFLYLVLVLVGRRIMGQTTSVRPAISAPMLMGPVTNTLPPQTHMNYYGDGSGEGPMHTTPMAHQSEEDMTRQQMMKLLRQHDSSNRMSIASNRSTYHVEMPPPPSVSNPLYASDEEMTRQQMLRLLDPERSRRQSTASMNSTYRIEMPQGLESPAVETLRSTGRLAP